jgi:hypothetical protein
MVLAVLFAVGTTGELVHAKQTPSQQQPTQTAPGQPSMVPPDLMGNGPDPATTARMQEQRQRMAEDDRHKRIVADTNKLLELATELKADVDKTGKNEMSIAVINKAAEIEKLSHDVKERMKN